MHEKSMSALGKGVIIFFMLALFSPFFTFAATCPNLYRNLSFGSRGQDVIELQNFLIGLGDLAAGNNTGYFGRMTEAAVKTWQVRNGVVSSGTAATTGYGAVGPRTRAKIASVCGGGNVSANFSAYPSSGSAPLAVTVSFAVPHKCPYGFDIDWGDGNKFPDLKPGAPIVSMCNPNPGQVEMSHSYTQPGTYMLTLKNPEAKTVTITVTSSQQSALDKKSSSATQIRQATLNNGRTRISIRYQPPTTLAFRSLGTPGENIQQAVQDNYAAQDAILTAHFGSLPALNGSDRSLQRVGTISTMAINASSSEIDALAKDDRVTSIEWESSVPAAI